MKDMLEGLDGLWARLELLHTGVTLSKQESRGHKDLASACTDAEVSRLSVVFTRKGSSRQLTQSLSSHIWGRPCPQSCVTMGKDFRAARLT